MPDFMSSNSSSETPGISTTAPPFPPTYLPLSQVFASHIDLLDDSFNVHGNMIKQGSVSWNKAVVAHFTGLIKPSAADMNHLVSLEEYS